MRLFRRKEEEKRFEYGTLSKIGLALAVELYNRHGYQGETPKLANMTIEFMLDDVEKDISCAPRVGLPGHTNAKLYVFRDLSNEYGFRLWVDTNDAELDEEIQERNLEAKARIEEAWESHGLPFESRDEEEIL